MYLHIDTSFVLTHRRSPQPHGFNHRQAGNLERPSEVSVPKDEVALRLAWEQASVEAGNL